MVPECCEALVVLVGVMIDRAIVTGDSAQLAVWTGALLLGNRIVDLARPARPEGRALLRWQNRPRGRAPRRHGG